MEVGIAELESKREEIYEAITPLFPTAQASAIAGIVDAFCGLTPPEYEGELPDSHLEYIKFDKAGRGGGFSRKPGNLVLNWRKLLASIPEAVSIGAGAINPWLMMLAGLQIMGKLWSFTEIQISPLHAMTLYTLWQHCDSNHKISEEAVLPKVNQYLTENRTPALNQQELAEVINDLAKMRCLEITEGIIGLREWVRKSY